LIYVLMKTEPAYPEQFVGLFTIPEKLQHYTVLNPPDEGSAYYILECNPDYPGVSRRIDIALVATITEAPPMENITVPVEMVQSATALGEPRRPFRMTICNPEGRELLQFFETGEGILDAIFKPEDLTPAATQFAREFMRLWRENYAS
jgi:hypothetical protein